MIGLALGGGAAIAMSEIGTLQWLEEHHIPVDVIAAIGAVHCLAALQAAPGIPAVFAVVLDPVEIGLVATARRPGGNATGVTNFDPGGAREDIRLLGRVVPDLRGAPRSGR